MGLLDLSGFVGDETVKDEFGLTQADRRQPLFSGLLKAGMLGMAAGQDITPGNRAQLLGQIGGAIGDIPEAMSRNRTEAAQMQLRRQQFQTNQQKLEQQRKIQAYATSPEGQQAFGSLSAPNQFAAKAALEAGDIDSFQRIITGAGAEAHRQKMETLAERRVGIAEETAARKEREATENPFGNTYEGRMYNVLLRGKRDPKFAESDEYAAAWNHFNRDQRPVAVGNTTILEPKLSNIGDFPSPGAQPAPGSPTATQPKIEFPKPGDPPIVDAAKGTEIWTEGDRSYVAHADDRVDVYDSTGKKLTTEAPKPIPPAEQAKMNDATALRAGINDSAQKFLARWKAASPLERAAALVNKSHPLNQAWVNTMLQAKGDALYQLGVLNKGDLPQLQKALSDPNTPMSAIFSSTEDVETQVADMLSVLDARRKSKENSYKEQRRRRPPQAAAGGGGGGGGGGGPKPLVKNPQTGVWE